jgi:hypothetical protein
MRAELITILIAAIAAPGFWEVIKTIITNIHDRLTGTTRISITEVGEKLDSQQKDIAQLKTSVAALEENETQKEVVNARRRILRFNDELLRKDDHSKEYFDDILNDVKTYEMYCRSHPDYPNGKADMAVRNIERCYELCLQKNSFLK